MMKEKKRNEREAERKREVDVELVMYEYSVMLFQRSECCRHLPFDQHSTNHFSFARLY